MGFKYIYIYIYIYMRMWTDTAQALSKISLQHNTKVAIPAIGKDYSCLRHLSDYWPHKEEFADVISNW
jgi:hypothetical protein